MENERKENRSADKADKDFTEKCPGTAYAGESYIQDFSTGPV
jgi:hypothetical protein